MPLKRWYFKGLKGIRVGCKNSAEFDFYNIKKHLNFEFSSASQIDDIIFIWNTVITRVWAVLKIVELRVGECITII